MKNIKFILLLIIVFMIVSKPFAQTILVSGNINSNTSWSADTVKITGDISVLQGITLSIEPGTYIESQGYYR
ncbi:MAG: hypothetical protein WCR72_15780, partial [Bacteroidota bacterium]